MDTTITYSDSSIDQKELFDDYSKGYDLMLKVNPAYQELIQKFTLHVMALPHDHQSDISVLDIGGGTGNFSKVIYDLFPNAKIDIIEPSSGMIALAKEKMPRTSTSFHETTLQKFKVRQQYDIVICVHALYLMENPKLQIPKMHELVKAGGHLLICDIGKKINVLDWSIYLFRKLIVKLGWSETIRYFNIGKAIKKANQKIGKIQNKGQVWRHSLKDFEAYFSPFFNILKAFNCYRNHSRFLICRK